MRLPYWRFANVVEHARREVLRELPATCGDVHVYTMSVDFDIPIAETSGDLRWGEFYPTKGPIVLYQLPYETMPDQENYYRQIKAVLRHEFEHFLGETHGEVMAKVAAR